MKPCVIKGCKQQAHVVPKLHIPATGWPLEAHEPIGILMDIPHCNSHRKKFKPRKFIKENENFRQLVAVVTTGKCPPDFKRVFATWIPMISQEYGNFKRMAEAQDDPNT